MTAEGALRDEIERVNQQDCRCVVCENCHGTGNIRVSYDPRGRVVPTNFSDGMYELEPCESCHNGIIEVCSRCELIEELYHQMEDA